MSYALRSGLAVLTLATALGGCAQNFPAASSAAATGAPVDQTMSARQPGLLVTSAPAPEVIYNAGSHDAVLSNSSGNINSGRAHIETEVTKKARELASDTDSLRDSTQAAREQLMNLKMKNEKRAADYYAAVAAVSTELQGGTTRGNPILVDKWNVAEQKLNILAQDQGLLSNLASDLTNQATRASYLLDATQNAFAISGAIPEDHKKLAVTQDELEQGINAINHLLNKTNDEITRQAAFLSTERANLQTLSLGISNGELYGQNLTNNIFRKTLSGDRTLFKGASASPMGNSMLLDSSRKPLVIVRFDRANVNYQQPLYTAVSQALEKFPAAKFDLVAVSNLEGNAAELALASAEARKNGEKVLHALQDMGVPLDRVRLSAASSKSVINREVHLYVQ